MNDWVNRFVHLLFWMATALWAAGFCYWSGIRGFFLLDQSMIFDGGYRVFLGQIPHLDFSNSFGPVTYWIQAFFFHLFGVKLIACVWSAAALNVLAALMAQHVVLRLFPARLGLAFVAGILTGTWFHGIVGFLWFEQTAHFFLLLGLWLALLGLSPSARVGFATVGLVLAGACAAISFIARQNIGIFALPIYAALALTARELPARRRIRAAIWVVLGAGSGVLLFAAWLWTQSDPNRFWREVIELPARLGGARLSRNAFRSACALIIGKGPVDLALYELAIVAAALAAGAGRYRQAERPERLQIERVLLLLAGGWVVQNVIAYTTLNNAINAFPYLGLLTALAFGMILNPGCARPWRMAGQACLAGAVLFLGARGFVAARDQTVLDIFEGATFENPSSYPGLEGMRWGQPTEISCPPHPEELSRRIESAELMALLDWLKAENRSFFVFPDFSALYGLAGQPPPHPQLFFVPNQSYDPEDNVAEDQRLVNSLDNSHVGIVLLEQVSWFGTAARLGHFPLFARWLEENFEPRRVFGHIQVYERAAANPGAAAAK